MKIYHFLFATFVFFGCQKVEDNRNVIKEEPVYQELYGQVSAAEEVVDEVSELGFNQKEFSPPSSTPPPAPTEHKINTTHRRVIKNADFRIQVENVDATTVKVIALAEHHQGYLANMELVNTNYEMTNRLTLKVPAEKFEIFLNSVGEEAVHTAHRRVTSQDVTAEFVDLQARLKTKKEVKERYDAILRKQTKTIAEVLETEEKIRRLQEEIEAAEGRLRLLINQTAMSTIRLEIYEPKEYEHEPIAYSESFWLKLWEGFENGWSGVTAIILVFVNAWPMVFMGAFAFWRRKKIFGRFYRAKNTA